MSDVTLRFKGDASSAVRAAGQTRAALTGVDGTGRKLARGLAVVGVALTAALAVGLGAAAKQAINFESSFAGVEKTVSGTPSQLQRLSDGIRDMAKEIPTGVNQLNEIAESAGQLGIRRQAILGFTRTVADLGETTNLAGEEGASGLARFANIVRTRQRDFDRLGSTIVALGNAGASTESEILGMGLRIAGAGRQIGLSEAKILGIANALSSVGIEAEAGGTAISRVMIEIEKSVRSGGERLEGFAEVAGTSTAAFKRAWERDAAGALATFIEGLGKLSDEGGNVFKVLEDLELQDIRVRDALLRASGAGDLLRDSLKTGSKAWKENTALTEEAQKRYDTTASALGILRNNVVDIAISIGNRVIPAIADGAQRLSGLVRDVDKADGLKAKISIVFENVRGAVAGLFDAVRDALTGTSQTKTLKLESGKIMEIVPPEEGFLTKWQRGLASAFASIDWTAVGTSIVDGITAGLSKGAKIANALLGVVGKALAAVDWVALGTKAGPFLAAALASAFVTITDPMFWIENWRLALAVGLAALGLLFTPARFAQAGILKRAITGLFIGVPAAIARGIAALAGAFWRGFVSQVAPRAAAGAAQVARRIIGSLTVLPRLVGSLMIQLARVAGERLGQLVVTGGRLAARFVAALIDVLRRLPSRVAPLIGQAVARIRGFISQFAAAARSIAAAIINGIVGGIKAGAAAIKDAAVNAVKGAIDGAKSFLRVGSPSKRARDEVGKPIAQGVAQGVTQASPLMRTALRRAVQKMIPRGGFQEFSQIAQQLFQTKLTAATTPAERELAAIDRRRQAEDLQRALRDAIEGGDAFTIQRAQEDIRLAELQERAIRERQRLDERQFLLQLRFQTALERLERVLSKKLTENAELRLVRRFLRRFGIPGFDAGGIVPGPRGALRLITAHAGETILPTHRRGFSGGDLHVHIDGTVIGVGKMQLARELAELINPELPRIYSPRRR